MTFPDPETVYVGESPGSTVPFTVSWCAIEIFVFNVTVLPALVVSDLKEVAPDMDWAVPPQITVALALALYAPELLQLPVSKTFFPEWLIVPFAPIVMFPDTMRAFAMVRVEAFIPVPRVRDLQYEAAAVRRG
jgi:hypothetical protein